MQLCYQTSHPQILKVLVLMKQGLVVLLSFLGSLTLTVYGLPLTVSFATQFDAFTVSNTLGPVNFFPGVYSGSLTYPANSTMPGTVIKVKAWAQLNSWSAGGNITFRCGANGNYVSMNVPSTTPINGYIMAEWDITIRNNPNFRGQGLLCCSGQGSILADGVGTWNSTLQIPQIFTYITPLLIFHREHLGFPTPSLAFQMIKKHRQIDSV